jgi:hypothetical protein
MPGSTRGFRFDRVFNLPGESQRHRNHYPSGDHGFVLRRTARHICFLEKTLDGEISIDLFDSKYFGPIQAVLRLTLKILSRSGTIPTTSTRRILIVFPALVVVNFSLTVAKKYYILRCS